jgi:Asp-tRNA(Asn)/Glu-tRNA(Gln) amidotransferase B subunit
MTDDLVKMARLAQRDDRMATGALYGDLADRIEALVKERDEVVNAIAIKGGTIHAPTQDAYDSACRAIEKHRSRAEAAEALIADCADYLKEGETPRQRMDRDHKDVLALMDMLAKEKIKREAAEAALAEATAIAEVLSGLVEYNYHGNIIGQENAKAVADLKKLKGAWE